MRFSDDVPVRATGGRTLCAACAQVNGGRILRQSAGRLRRMNRRRPQRRPPMPGAGSPAGELPASPGAPPACGLISGATASRPSTFTRPAFEGTMYFVFWPSVLFSTSRRRMISARSLKKFSAAVETKRTASASALARVTRAWASPSALRISDCLMPSAWRIWLCRMPSDSRMLARLSRSAFICRDIASVISVGGSIFCTSTRVSFTPQALVASSSTLRRLVLMTSRATRVSSSARSPIRLRRVGLGKRGASVAEVLHFELGFHGVDHLVVHDRVHRHGHVVLGDHLLRIHADHLFAHVHPDQLVHKRHQEVQA